MTSSDKYTVETITYIQPWNPNLFTFRTTRFSGYRFIPGQFARLGIPDGDRIIWRPYSIASANWDEHLEFYSIVVPEGEFTPRLAQLRVGDTLLVDKTNYGFLTTDRFECGKDLWMLSTGTGLAPFVSILHDFDTWQQYDNLILVHGVRHANELGYAELLRALPEHEIFGEFAHKLHYVQAVTREDVPGALRGRITELLDSGELECTTGVTFDAERARVMICGNPDLVEDLRGMLTARGMSLAKRGRPGHFAIENAY
ncbi:ferredoxin--NADP+ reductase [Plasticicumulans lactativorans]|uniref:ferredoxin--NADP(+) reductase n=1 Tax=Plasticicumulans lactativorans TaxID=1133106 RepID=A0A4R2L714_9GAMM|nr:ferredoxin--NADP reductase [Plasticicumulans lactativorans]TCO82727.1 ferredoxin--NADP+ reductase [Plasticicumulans lactativorans]